MEEALYLQIQAEQRREVELQQMLVRERLIHEHNIRHMKMNGDHLQDLPSLQQHYSQLLLGNSMARGAADRVLLTERLRAQAEEELASRRETLRLTEETGYAERWLQEHTAKRKVVPQSISSTNSPVRNADAVPRGFGAQKMSPTNNASLRDIAADSLAGNAIRRGEVDKRKYAEPDTTANTMLNVSSPGKKRPRANTNDSTDISLADFQEKKGKPKKPKKAKNLEISSRPPKRSPESKKKQKKSKEHAPTLVISNLSATHPPQKKKGRKPKMKLTPLSISPPQPSFSPKPATPSTPRGTFRDILEAAHIEDKSDDAVTALLEIKAQEGVEWPDSDHEATSGSSLQGFSCGETIRISDFISTLPSLPEEPSLASNPSSKETKHKGLLDDDSVEEQTTNAVKSYKTTKSQKGTHRTSTEDAFKDLPYPVDNWWPSSLSIRKERKVLGQDGSDEDDNENTFILGSENKFRANIDKIKSNLANNVQPGFLEKIPHCKIHRMLLQRRKSTAPELVYCWQVTELYPNDLMVCCSQCGTWRHTACGGHHKPYSVREATEEPFSPICDRCYEEDKIMEEHPVARKRLERQRCEQIRRGLATSATMRQASFSKHGGTYKWPLGSVSATHVGGHTRSVHTRHDKAEKQWTDMAAKLSKEYGSRPKDRIKHRTKELERLLISVEDAGKRSCVSH